ncbi:MAG: nicotinamide mononucleotide transporter [Phycisphaerae bacterium]
MGYRRLRIQRPRVRGCTPRRRRACFALWLVSNAITFGIHAAAGMWPLAARDGAFFIMAIHGWRVWSDSSRKERR